MGAQEAKDAGYLCMKCAEVNGGVWPDGHRASFHGGRCPLCNSPQAALACWDDWEWPDDSRLNQVAKTTREF